MYHNKFCIFLQTSNKQSLKCALLSQAAGSVTAEITVCGLDSCSSQSRHYLYRLMHKHSTGPPQAGNTQILYKPTNELQTLVWPRFCALWVHTKQSLCVFNIPNAQNLLYMILYSDLVLQKKQMTTFWDPVLFQRRQISTIELTEDSAILQKNN